MNLPFQISNEVAIGVITFLIPILFAYLKRGVTPYFTKRSKAKADAKFNKEVSRQETVESLVTACKKATIEQLRVLIPQLLSIGERPDLDCLLDYIEKEDSHRLKAVKKALFNECKQDPNTKELVAMAVSLSPDLATELAEVMAKLA